MECNWGKYFFIYRFRRKFIGYNHHFEEPKKVGLGCGFNRSEIKMQIEKNIMCMIVIPDGKVYVIQPEEVMDFIRQFNSVKSFFLLSEFCFGLRCGWALFCVGKRTLYLDKNTLKYRHCDQDYKNRHKDFGRRCDVF